MARNFGVDLSLGLEPSPSVDSLTPVFVSSLELGFGSLCFACLFSERAAAVSFASPPPTPLPAAAAFSIMAAAVAAAAGPMRLTIMWRARATCAADATAGASDEAIGAAAADDDGDGLFLGGLATVTLGFSNTLWDGHEV